MTENLFSLPPPRLSAFFQFLRSLLQKFNPRRVVFLNKKGAWAENPVTLRDRISHSFLFDLWKRGESASFACLEKGLPSLVDEPTWPLIQKIGENLSREDNQPRASSPTNVHGSHPTSQPEPQTGVEWSSFLLFEILLWLVERWSTRLNAEAHVPTWNTQNLALREHFRLKLCGLDHSIGVIFSEEEKYLFLQAVSEVEKASSDFLEPLARLIAEEEKITVMIENLLEAPPQGTDKTEAYGAIIERLQPPMGIVTELPPALFLPSLRLLLDPRVGLQSGIPYMASVALSVFNDPRSAGAFLEALEHYPLSATKIRENLIYTLGNLREPLAVTALARVLEGPDEIVGDDASAEKKPCLLLEQKEEAIWALGKIGFPSVRAIPSLVRYAEHPSARLRTYLAWALGEIGQAQKEKSGGVSADVVIALLRLLKEKNRQVFEEAASGLKKIQMPEFLHSLYLYSTGAVSILGLKPAQRGLNELSETVHYLLKTKKRVVLAVNGDSGTGKTYFCQAIVAGFGGLQPSEILYLMRDSKRGQKVFNRLLGLAWLKQHIDPAYYQDHPLPEVEDDPEAFFRLFLHENADKRLILLDGCRDRHYFQKVIDIFYENEELDIEVNFRANFSTRRLNLEERERALESVKIHLAFLEEPALEDTSFYQEGLVILYDLDNSLGSRIDLQETRELFETSRIDSWGEFIRIGTFSGETRTRACQQDGLSLEEGKFVFREEAWPETCVIPFSPEEEILKPHLNEDLAAEPNLLMTIPLGGLRPHRLRFYAQEQIAGCETSGGAFVLTLLDNRLFKTKLKDSILESTLLGRNFFLRTEEGRLLNLSFERNEITDFLIPPERHLAIAAWPPDCLITAGEEGSVCIWNFAEKKIFRLSAGLAPSSALAADASGKIYTWNQEGLWRWDFLRKRLNHVVGLDARVRLIRPYVKGKILAVEDTAEAFKAPRLFIIDFEKEKLLTLSTPLPGRITNVNFSADGRILVGLTRGELQDAGLAQTLAILTPGEDACVVAALSGHGQVTRDCLPLGPRLITCGEEPDGASTIRLWGSAFFVRTELGKRHINYGVGPR